MANELQNKVFHDEAKARKWLEGHLWPDGSVCSHCGTVNNATAMRAVRASTSADACQKPFTADLGTLYERSHIPLHKWLLAALPDGASKKGMSAHQL